MGIFFLLVPNQGAKQAQGGWKGRRIPVIEAQLAKSQTQNGKDRKKVAKWQQQIKYIITHKNKPNSNASFNNNNTVGRRRGRARRLVGGGLGFGAWILKQGSKVTEVALRGVEQ